MPLDLAGLSRLTKTSSPKTVLGFYATVLGFLLLACVIAVIGLAQTGTATYLIPWILLFGGGVFVALLAGVFVITLIDPSKLMLGKVSGFEYAVMHRVKIGDSLSGEIDQILIEPSSPTKTTDDQNGHEPRAE